MEQEELIENVFEGNNEIHLKLNEIKEDFVHLKYPYINLII